MLDWPYVQRRFPWGVAILFGGGFALAGDNHTIIKALSELIISATRIPRIFDQKFSFLTEASKRSGLSVWIGQELGVLGGLPDWAMVVIVCILVKVHCH